MARDTTRTGKGSEWMSKSVEGSSSGRGRYGRSRNESETARGVAALETLPDAELTGAVLAVLRAGDAVALGTTRDGGALAITTFSGGMAEKFYASSDLEIHDLLMMLERAASS